MQTITCVGSCLTIPESFYPEVLHSLSLQKSQVPGPAQVLCLQGFLAAQKHADRIILYPCSYPVSPLISLVQVLCLQGFLAAQKRGDHTILSLHAGIPDASLSMCGAQVLCLQGFLAARKHADRIILLAEMMQHSGCPCFRSGSHKPLAALRRRFHLSATESQVPHEKNQKFFEFKKKTNRVTMGGLELGR